MSDDRPRGHTPDRLKSELLLICLLAAGVGGLSVVLLGQISQVLSLSSLAAHVPGATSALILSCAGLAILLGRRARSLCAVYDNALRNKAQREEPLRLLSSTTTRVNQPVGEPPSDIGQQDPRNTGIPVLLVDDHAMVRQGLRSIMETFPNIEIIGEASNGSEALKLVKKRRPRVVLMDINMPKLNGIEATAQIKSEHPEVAVIGLSVNAESANQEAMKKAGATMLLPKEAVFSELYKAIVAVSAKPAYKGSLPLGADTDST